MITFIHGKFTDSDLHSVTVRVGGISLRVLVPTNVHHDIGAVGDLVTLATRLLVRDDRLELFGFSTEVQATLFDQLQSVSGVGPKLALAILSTFTPEQFSNILEAEDLRQLTRVNGLGKRTASRLILELSGKLAPTIDGGSEPDDTADALTALGYSAAEIARVLGHADVQAATTVEERIGAALRQLGA